MENLFLKLLNMSITASWLVVAIIILRFFLKKAPKFITVIMWALVGIRLVCPFSFESVLSLIPSGETLPPEILSGPSFDLNSGIDYIDQSVNDYLGDRYFEGVTVPTDNGLNVMRIMSVIWVIGVILMLLYTLISYFKISNRVKESVVLRDNIRLCDRIDTPFILGIIAPKIYLPSNINNSDTEYVIAHEKAHIKRCDHLWKPLGFILLAVYWFNPLIWLAYALLCRDIELACDQKVIKELGEDIKKPYSEALINCSVSQKAISACPLAFGETGVKTRIKSILNYKKPMFWVVLLAIAVLFAAAVCFLTNPPEKTSSISTQIGGDTHKAKLTLINADLKGESPNLTANFQNLTEETLCYGSDFKLYLDGKQLNMADGYGWDLVLYTIKPKEDTEINLSLAGFDISNSGIYRLEKEFYFEESKEKKYTVYFDFNVEKQKVSENSTQSQTETSSDSLKQNPYFNATVLEIKENSILVEPFPNEDERKSSDKISVSTDVISKNPLPKLKKGDEIRIVYNGEILEIYPAMIHKVFAIYPLKDNGETEYYSPLISFGIDSVTVLSRNHSKDKFEITRTFEDKTTTQNLEKYLNERFCEEKNEGNWVKFNPGRPNNYALAISLENGNTLILNIHFTPNGGSPYYIAMASITEKFDASIDYSKLQYKRYVADNSFGEFLEKLIV